MSTDVIAAPRKRPLSAVAESRQLKKLNSGKSYCSCYIYCRFFGSITFLSRSKPTTESMTSCSKIFDGKY